MYVAISLEHAAPGLAPPRLYPRLPKVARPRGPRARPGSSVRGQTTRAAATSSRHGRLRCLSLAALLSLSTDLSTMGPVGSELCLFFRLLLLLVALIELEPVLREEVHNLFVLILLGNVER